MIDDTKKYIEKNYKGTRVIYGDTDSVMVKMPRGLEQEGLWKLGQNMVDDMNAVLFKSPNKLELEKIFGTFILYKKKNYSGVYQEFLNGPTKMDNKGTKFVRREVTPLAKELLGMVQNTIHFEKNTTKAIEQIKNYTLEILEGKMSFDKFVMNKKLGSEYKNPNIAHAVLAEKINTRSGREIYTAGDRVDFIFVENLAFNKGTPQYLRLEDPVYAQEHGMKLDYRYYIEKQIEQALVDCCQFIQSDLKDFFKDISIGGNGKMRQLSINQFFS